MQARFLAIIGILFAAKPQAIAMPKEGCAVTVQDQCNAATTPDGRAQQCLQLHKDGLSDPCRAAMAQNPPPGIAKHLGTESMAQAISQAAPSPFAVKLSQMPPMPVRAPVPPPALSTVAIPPPPTYTPPKVILAKPNPAPINGVQN